MQHSSSAETLWLARLESRVPHEVSGSRVCDEAFVCVWAWSQGQGPHRSKLSVAEGPSYFRRPSLSRRVGAPMSLVAGAPCALHYLRRLEGATMSARHGRPWPHALETSAPGRSSCIEGWHCWRGGSAGRRGAVHRGRAQSKGSMLGLRSGTRWAHRRPGRVVVARCLAAEKAMRTIVARFSAYQRRVAHQTRTQFCNRCAGVRRCSAPCGGIAALLVVALCPHA